MVSILRKFINRMMVLHQVASADRQTEELAPSTSGPCSIYWNRPTTNANTVTDKKLQVQMRIAGSDMICQSSKPLLPEKNTQDKSEPTVPVATPAVTNREATPQSPPSEAPVTAQGFGKGIGQHLAADQASEVDGPDAVNDLLHGQQRILTSESKPSRSRTLCQKFRAIEEVRRSKPG